MGSTVPNIQTKTLRLAKSCNTAALQIWKSVWPSTMTASVPLSWNLFAILESEFMIFTLPPVISHTDCCSTFEEEVTFSRGVYDLCKKYGIIFIADEVRMGSCKTGKFFSFNHLGDDVKPDLLVIGKSMTGGAYPASFVLGNAEIMSVVGPYESGSTFGHSPMAIAAAEAALKVLDDENMAEKAAHLGKRFTELTRSWPEHPHVGSVEVRGADFSVKINENREGRVTARRIGGLCLSRGVVLYPLEGRLRMSVSMVMTDAELEKGVEIIKSAIDDVTEYHGAIPGEVWHKL